MADARRIRNERYAQQRRKSHDALKLVVDKDSSEVERSLVFCRIFHLPRFLEALTPEESQPPVARPQLIVMRRHSCVRDGEGAGFNDLAGHGVHIKQQDLLFVYTNV